MIKFDKVNIKYIKDYYSLFNINFEIDKNTILLGDETSGNNFVLRVLAKIDKNYEGEVFVDDKNLKEIKDNSLNLAYVPNEIYLFKNKSVFFNLFYPFKIRKINTQIATEKILSALKIFDVRNYINLVLDENEKSKLNKLDDLQFFKKVKVKNLKNLAQKMIMFLRAVIREPKYILCENLFSNFIELDAQNFRNLANKIIKNTNSIFILAENENPNLENFNIITFDAGSIKNRA